MKARMSKQLREILSDPKKARQLHSGVSTLKSDKESIITIGNEEYKIQFVAREKH